MNQTSKEVKQLLYTVNNIVVGEELHLRMDRDDVRDLEILEGTFIYVKIYIHERIPPLKMNFKYVTTGDLEIYASRRHLLPSQS